MTLDILTNTDALFKMIWGLFAGMTLIGITAHLYITSHVTPKTNAYGIRFFMFAFGSFGVISLPVMKLLETMITTPQEYAALYLTGLIIGGIYLFIMGVKLIPEEHKQPATQAQTNEITIE